MIAPIMSVEDILARMRVPGELGLFVLGCFERPATVYMQQVRALNLIYALNAQNRAADTTLIVIGAGAGGLTAAAAAAVLGWHVSVLDEIGNDVLSLAGAITGKRWLHPHIYDWPDLHTERPSTDLGVMDWSAGPADKVVEDLRQRWKALEMEYAIDTHLGIHDSHVANLDGGYLVQWNGQGPRPRGAVGDASGARRIRRLHAKRADIVILAVGFGREEPSAGFPGVKSYWDNDEIDRNKTGAAQTPVVLISGTGDGGLIDALRYSFNDFKHEKVLDQVRDDYLGPDAFETVKRRLAEIETTARTARVAGAAYEAALNWAYRELVDSLTLQKPIALRQDVDVVLTGTTRFPLSLEAAPINRFLFSLTSAQYIPGPVTKAERRDDGQWAVVFRANERMLYFNDVVIRHGPMSTMRRHFSDIYDRCKPLIDEARFGSRDPTRDPCYDATFAEMLRKASAKFQRTEGLDSNAVRQSLSLAKPEDTGVQELGAYRAALIAQFESSTAQKLTHGLSRLALKRLIGDAGSVDAADLDAEWLRTGAPVRLISGDAGTGKSTLLRFLLTQAASDERLVPLYVQSRMVRRVLAKPFFLAVIDWCLDSLQSPPLTHAEHWGVAVLRMLMQGRVIVFFDGLDELLPDLQRWVIDMIEADESNFKRGNRLLLSSRPGSYGHSRHGLEVLAMTPPSAQQLRSLLMSIEPMNPTARKSLATIAGFLLRAGGIQPELILRMVRSIPLNDAGWAGHDWVRWWIREVYGVSDKLHGVLGELALSITLEGRFEISVSEAEHVVRRILDRPEWDGIRLDEVMTNPLLYTDDDCISFVHKTPFETLASEALARRGNAGAAISLTLDGPLSTSDIVPMTLGLMGKQRDVFEIMQALPDSIDFKLLQLRLRVTWFHTRLSQRQFQRLVDDVHGVVSDAELASDEVILAVAFACSGSADSVASAVLSKVAEELKAPAVEVQYRALRFMEYAGLHGATQFMTPLLLSPEAHVCAAAARALGTLGDQAAIPALLQAYLSSKNVMVFSEAVDAIRRVGGGAARKVLLQILEDESHHQNIRWPAAEQLGKLGDRQALAALVKACSDEWAVVRSAAARAAGRFAEPTAVATLIGCLDDSEASVRIAAAEGLIGIAATTETVRLLRSLDDTHPVVRTAAARALVRLDPDGLLKVLRDVIEREGDSWRAQAVEFLHEILGSESLSTLLLLSQGPAADVRLGAARALAHQGGDDAIARLVALTEDPSEDVRYAAVEGLPARPNPAIAIALARRLALDGANPVGLAAAKALEHVGGPIAMSALCQAVERGHPTAVYAAFPLSAIGGEEAIATLAVAWRTYSDNSLGMQHYFSRAIGRIDGELAAATLRQFYEVEEWQGRVHLVVALSEMKHPAAVANLLLALSDDSERVRQEGRWALQAMATSQLRLGLLLALHDARPSVQRQAVQLCPFYADEPFSQALEGVDAAALGADGESVLENARSAMRTMLSMR